MIQFPQGGRPTKKTIHPGRKVCFFTKQLPRIRRDLAETGVRKTFPRLSIIRISSFRQKAKNIIKLSQILGMITMVSFPIRAQRYNPCQVLVAKRLM